MLKLLKLLKYVLRRCAHTLRSLDFCGELDVKPLSKPDILMGAQGDKLIILWAFILLPATTGVRVFPKTVPT